MALYIRETKENKTNKLMVIFSGGGKFVWYPTKEEIEYLLITIIKKEKTNGKKKTN